MRTIRFMHFCYIALMLMVDAIVNSMVQNLGFPNIIFVGNLHFIALLLLTQTDSREESIVKAAILGIWLDILHLGSFPIFFIVYTLTLMILRLWNRYIGSNLIEIVILVIIGLFIKELLMHILVYVLKSYNMGFIQFMTRRVFWVIVGNILILPIATITYRYMHKLIMKHAQNMYVR